MSEKCHWDFNPSFKLANELVWNRYTYMHINTYNLQVREQTFYLHTEHLVSVSHTHFLMRWHLRVSYYLYVFAPQERNSEIMKLWFYIAAVGTSAFLLFRDGKKNLYSKCKRFFSGEGRESLQLSFITMEYKQISLSFITLRM